MSKSKVRIAVVGPGRMGIGISQIFAYAGHEVDLIDIKERSESDTVRVLTEASNQIENNLMFMASLNLMDKSVVGSVLNKIRFHKSDRMESILPQADIVFEAVPEVLDVKKMTFSRISSSVGDHAMIASTTSTILVDTLASFVARPERFLNTHWLNPAYLIPLVEVSPSAKTKPEVVQEMLTLLESVGKTPIKCSASPGFIVPRIQALAMNEAARLAAEGVATPEDIDKATRVGFGLRFAILGLLEFIDWGGGDILYYADSYLEKALESDRFKAPDIISQKMRDGHIGMKTGKGFYDFSSMDVQAYQQETMKKFIDLIDHLGLLPSLGEEFKKV
jgi:3-hydroxybutyryl-CoA dehydrogenase